MRDQSIFEHFIEQARHNENVALSDGVAEWRYCDMVQAAEHCAQWIRSQEINVIALQADNSPAWVIWDLAAQLAPCVLLPLPSFFSRGQINHCLKSAGANVLISDQSALEGLLDEAFKASPLPLPKSSGFNMLNAYKLKSTPGQFPAETRKITFTSGSTGEPKGVCLDQAQQWRVAQSIRDRVTRNMTEPAQIRHFCMLPLATLLENVAGLYAALLAGGQVILANEKSRGLSGSSGLDLSALLASLNHHQPTSLIVLPQILMALVAAAQRGMKPPTTLDFVAVGGAKVSERLIAQARAAGIAAYQGYGLSECASVVALSDDDSSPDSVGRLLPHLSVKIVDGEIVLLGNAFLGYLGQPDSWYPEEIHTGDLGSIDADGKHVHIRGRRKNLLITSYGRNVSPEWVEAELSSQPLFTRCVVGGESRPHLFALLGSPDFVTTQQIQNWIDLVNCGLPDYAQIHQWMRLKDEQWNQYFTANGRPKREAIYRVFTPQIDAFYDPAENSKSFTNLHPGA